MLLLLRNEDRAKVRNIPRVTDRNSSDTCTQGYTHGAPHYTRDESAQRQAPCNSFTFPLVLIALRFSVLPSFGPKPDLTRHLMGQLIY